MRSRAGGKEAPTKISITRYDCFAQLQRHARSHAGRARWRPIVVEAGVAILHGTRRQLNHRVAPTPATEASVWTGGRRNRRCSGPVSTRSSSVRREPHSLRQLLSAAALGGIGFTMSLYRRVSPSRAPRFRRGKSCRGPTAPSDATAALRGFHAKSRGLARSNNRWRLIF